MSKQNPGSLETHDIKNSQGLLLCACLNSTSLASIHLKIEEYVTELVGYLYEEDPIMIENFG